MAMSKQETLMECLTCSHLKTAENWIELEPFVSSEDEISIYRLESTAGCYECKVSGLRWVCKKKVTLQYHFRPWDPHRGLLQSMGYRQGGPLLDIKIIAGKLEEVHLPHFACFGVEDHYNPTIEQSVRVLSVEDNNVSIGKVDKVTRFHVKIVHPSFSLRGVILQALGFSVHSDLLIYQDKTAHLTLRTYLIPYDPALKERIELAHINPPNFYEVFIKDADFDFRLNLCCKGRKQLKWSQEIREAEYRRPPPDSPDQQSPAGGSRLGRSPE
ncbi:NACHT, LRR and PYD domains-containing protein 1 isoform X3 [Esox lucius]|uniref:NACHT, LRR and PYD domains-containing protein 1 isoform X3 n=1 Tax=Esox lucius TaxID=8010 RepID=UPI0014774685|nr:NACHT, LRR and PYD domains-containing protein 1 isoform X3 [Esox lucius]